MTTIPVEEEVVLGTEYTALGGAGKARRALSISGGGIRSATFALGVLQGLAERGLLGQFDYLSTVSGGGYIGSWLTAWLHRCGGMGEVEPMLRPEADGARPVAHLREYNSYLTPKLGALSVDTWTLAAIVIRNLVLNWLVIVPLLVAVILLPRVMVSLHAFDPPWVTMDPILEWPLVLRGVFWVACICFTASVFNMFRLLPTLGRLAGTAWDYVAQCCVPLVLAATLYSLHYWWQHAPGKDRESIWALGAALTGMAALAWVLFLLFCARERAAELLLGPFTFGVAVLGVTTAGSTWLLSNVLIDIAWKHTAVFAALSVPVLLGGAGGGMTIFVGFTSRYLQDADREWLARASAYVMLLGTGWLAVSALSLLLPHELMKLEGWIQSALAAGGGAAGWITAAIGRSSATGENAQGSRWGGVATKVALPVFVVTLFTGLALGLDYALPRLGLTVPDLEHQVMVAAQTPIWVAAGAVGVMVAVSWLAGLYININTFSLHGMYRNRLVRAYLAASNPDRKVNPFTGFAESDNLRMKDLRGQRPIPVVNLALNVAATNNLAWQERKAESFVVTPWYCGHARLGYRDAAEYGGRRGISLGTAMTISGAAASPNMGYHTSPLVSFVMMLFNARLGAWLGNPGRAGDATWREPGPRSAVASVVKEALALTTDQAPYVYLSDGGHFENLALYEMVRRRCRTVVVLDGGCDPDLTYEDLGNAMRKVRIDFRIPIEFDAESLAALRAKKQRFAVGRIVYSAVDAGAEDGRLLYIKPMMMGNEPPDVTSYQVARPSFPHESTGDQWFSEAQTESYRVMGICTVRDILRGWKGGTLEDALEYLAPSKKSAAAGGGLS
jgi:hypothetical protein